MKFGKNSPSRVNGVVRTQWRIFITVRVMATEALASENARHAMNTRFQAAAAAAGVTIGIFEHDRLLVS